MINGTNELLNSLRTYSQPVLGVSVTAFTRTGPAFLLPDYRILCLKETNDLSAIRQQCRVVSIEKDLGGETPERQNTSSILSQSEVEKYLKTQAQGFNLLVYKSAPKTEKIVHALGGRVMAPPSAVRDPFEDKKEFRVLAAQAGLPLLPGETLRIDTLNPEKFSQLQNRYGPKLVFQLTDYTVGGGIGTVFVESQEKLDWLLGYVQRRREGGKELTWVNATPFMEGEGASINGMVTREGVLAGPLQMQLLDVPEVTAFKGRSGVFCGHDWAPQRFNDKQQKQAETLVQILGRFMAEKGYRGVFGIDVIVNQERDKVYPIECNARYTAAFPAYAMLQLAAGEPSFDAFQLAEFLDFNYSFSLDAVQSQWRESLVGGQLVLHNQTRRWIKIQGRVKAGVYRWKKEGVEWVREGFAMQDIKDLENEFVYTDGVPEQGRIYKPGERMGRLLFRKSIAVSHREIGEWSKAVIKKIAQDLALKRIKKPEELFQV
jgi:hypothetical protein